MDLFDEKDYIMRMIKQMIRVLFSLMFGKKYNAVEIKAEDKYEVSGMKLMDLLNMVDKGEINEAENMVLSAIDYSNKDEVAAVALFYQYLSEKEDDFLIDNNYTRAEVLEGVRQLLKEAGYSDLASITE